MAAVRDDKYAILIQELADAVGNPQQQSAILDQIAALIDPNADRLMFWDDSVGAVAYLTLGTNLSITGTTLDAAGGGSSADWHGVVMAAYGRGDPQQLFRMAQSGSVAATPTNIATTVARIAYFRPPADITVNKVRYFGVGVTANIYRIAIYNADTLARVATETAFTTASQAWGSVYSSLGLTLTKDQLYFIAVGVNAVGTTAGLLCIGGSPGATTGRVGSLPKSFPGSLNIDSGYIDGAYAQGAVTAGALPATFPTVSAQAAWTGGFPLFFLDSNNA